MTAVNEHHQGEGSLLTGMMTGPWGEEEGHPVVAREPLELVESLGRPFSGHLGMETVPEGHWSQTKVSSPSYCRSGTKS